MNEDGLSLGTQGGDRVSSVVQDEVEVRILFGVGVVDEPYLDVVACLDCGVGNIVGAQPAEGDDSIDAHWRPRELADSGEPHVVVVRVTGERMVIGYQL